MDHNVLFTNRCKAIAAMLANTLRETRIVGYEFEVIPRDRNDLRNHVERQKTFMHADAVFRNAKFRRHEDAQGFWHFAVKLNADNLTATTAFQCCLEETNEIFRLFFHFDIAVTNDAERTGAAHFVTGEQSPDEQAHRVLDGDEAVGVLLVCRQLNEALERDRNTQKGRHRMIVGAARKLQGDGKAEVRNERERMRRINGEWRQDRENRFEEVVFKPFLFGL